jgi:hypothetical protein
MPFAEAPPPEKRVIPPHESIWYIIPQISGLFLELKSFIGMPHSEPNELVPKMWQEENEIQPFFARVWADCDGDSEALPVKRRETIQVLQAPNTPYWFCQKLSGEKGFVLSAVLEPVE